MAAITTEREGDQRRLLGRRLLWFVALWLLGVATLAAIGALIRAVVF